MLLGFQPISLLAAPLFGAQAVIAGDPNTYHCTHVSGSQTVSATNVLSSTNQYVQISGEPANTPVNVQYDLNLSTSYPQPYNGESILKDDFYSGIVTCDSTGKYRHYALNTSTGTMKATASPAFSIGSATSGSWTNFSHAIADIYDVNNLSLKSHLDSASAVKFVYP